MLEIKSFSIDKIQEAAGEFVKVMNNKKVVAFYGELGSGKTTFIKAVCFEMGVTDVVSSPTFALLNEYKTGKGEMICHLDLYRIEQVSELFDIGYEDYFYGDFTCFIEWPEKAEHLLPADCMRVMIIVEEDGSRTLRIKEN